MPIRLFTLCLVLVALLAPSLRAQDAAADLKTLVETIQGKLRAGQSSAEQLAPELARFETLLEKYRGQKTEEVARIAFMRATLFFQVLDDAEKGTSYLKQLQADFPGTAAALNADRAIAAIADQKKAEQARAGLVGQPAPELNFNWSTREGLKTLSSLRGKVVVLDFWATWCGPCLSSFPQVRDLVAHYAAADVVVLGVTSIQGRVANLESAVISTQGDPDRERGLMPAFIKARDMTWPVVFSDEPVFNPAYGVQGIPHMTIIAPDGTVRHNGLHPGSPLPDKTAKIDAILREFKLTVPGEKKG
ncbi:MAG: TlpA disulfide reductase family protein [Opitutaceae bacterium]|nr:TlpA disulfide reductase family protein [Opitutaceae bacterium]